MDGAWPEIEARARPADVESRSGFGLTAIARSPERVGASDRSSSMKPLSLLAFLLLALPAAAVAGLNPAERRMAEVAAQESSRSIQLLERLVNQNSGTLNFEGVAAVGRMVREELEPLGFEVRWVDMREAGRAGHLVATHHGSRSGKRVLLIGHLDTVFEPCAMPTSPSS
jgi:glutamate carboxypeptidase